MFKVLIAVDGTEPALRAVATVAKMAQVFDGLEAILVNVRSGALLDPLFAVEYNETTIRKLDAEQESWQTKVLSDAQEYAKSSGLKITVCLRLHGIAANEIVRAAQEQHVDQIAMGTHGRSAVGGLLLGSIAQKVIHLTDIPVLLVK
jgi:nucleotide-binding universal stress UspA family protein